MLIWRGHGYWVFLLPLLTLGVFVHADKSLPAFAANKQLWVVAGLASAGLVCALWGFFANRGGAVQAIDRLTGLIVTIRVRHSLYGIPMQYWGGVYLLAAGAVCLLQAR
jgi:hypothetical protein